MAAVETAMHPVGGLARRRLSSVRARRGDARPIRPATPMMHLCRVLLTNLVSNAARCRSCQSSDASSKIASICVLNNAVGVISGHLSQALDAKCQTARTLVESCHASRAGRLPSCRQNTSAWHVVLMWLRGWAKHRMPHHRGQWQFPLQSLRVFMQKPGRRDRRQSPLLSLQEPGRRDRRPSPRRFQRRFRLSLMRSALEDTLPSQLTTDDQMKTDHM